LRGGLAFRDEKDEARKILGVVLHRFGENDAAVMVGARVLSWRARTSRTLPAVSSAGTRFHDGWSVNNRSHCTSAMGCEATARMSAANDAPRQPKVMFDGQNCFSDNLQGTFQKQIEDANYRAGQAIFDGDKQCVSAIFYGRKCGIECTKLDTALW
jgi:hypothetical protein